MTKDRTVLLKPHPPLSKKFAGEDGVWRELVSGDGDPSELNEIKDKLEVRQLGTLSFCRAELWLTRFLIFVQQLALLVLPDDYDGEILPEEVVEQTTRFILSISQEIVEYVAANRNGVLLGLSVSVS